jgi:Ser/Thr protein kinase RdoA (MazF antagonist)
VNVRSGHETPAQDEAQNLTVDTVVPYLFEQNLLSAAVVVSGDLEVVDVGRRNQNLKIVRRHGPSYLLKQAGEGEPATTTTIRSEAAFYRHCQLDPDAATLRGLIPNLYRWDEARCLLIVELIDGSPLWAHYAATTVPEFPSDAAAPLGEALGTVHRVFRERSSRSRAWLAGLRAYPPWILLAHRPTPEVYLRLSPASLQVLRLIQQDQAMAAALDRLRQDWAPKTVVHNDLKGDNILVKRITEERTSVHLVDWELIQIGDAAWDVGTVFRDFLDYWLLSVPLSGDLTAEQMLQGAQIPLSNIHPATRAFWRAYHSAAQLDGDILGPFLLRSVRFAAARLAQGAYELSLSRQYPSNYALAMLQLATNILADPRDSALHLFGIPTPWRRP